MAERFPEPEPEHEVDSEPILRPVLVRIFCLTREAEREGCLELGDEAAKRKKCDDEGGARGVLESVLARVLLMVLVLPLALVAPKPVPALGLLALPLSMSLSLRLLVSSATPAEKRTLSSLVRRTCSCGVTR